MAHKVRVSYYVRPPVARAIKQLAAREDRSQSDIAEEALEAYLSELQDHRDLLGAAESAFTFWDNPVDAAYDDV